MVFSTQFTTPELKNGRPLQMIKYDIQTGLFAFNEEILEVKR